MREPVKATRVENAFDSEVDGAYELQGGHILFVCPCGCGVLTNLPVKLDGQEGRGWTWNGNEECPDIQPSIRQLSGCKFHGYLTNGMWTFCGDSGQ